MSDSVTCAASGLDAGSQLDGRVEQEVVFEVKDEALENIRYAIAKNLFCLEDWCRWKNREYSDEEAVLAIESWFEDGYIGRTSSGWGYIEDTMEDSSDDGELELEVNWMGHLFVFGRAKFLTAIESASTSHGELAKELTNLASQVAPVAESAIISKTVFEQLFGNGHKDAYEWQESVPDAEDCDSVLLSFLTKIRQPVSARTVLLY